MKSFVESKMFFFLGSQRSPAANGIVCGQEREAAFYIGQINSEMKSSESDMFIGVWTRLDNQCRPSEREKKIFTCYPTAFK